MAEMRFHEFELSIDELRLLRAGEVVKIEPRLLEVLIYLARHADRVVSKEELVATVWEGRFVSDSAISRAIYELRKALDDDSRAPRFLRTVHGRGYQFVAELVLEDVGGSEAPPRRISTLPIGLATLAVLAAASFGILMQRPAPLAAPAPPELPTPTPQTRLALLPVLADEHAGDLQLIALSFTDLLHRRLRETSGLSLRAPDYSSQVATEPESVAVFARDSGAEYVLSGTLSRGGRPDTVKIELELVDFRQGRSRLTPLGPFSIQRPDATDFSEFLSLRDAVADRILRLLEPALAPPRDDPSRPRDFAAYRLAILALQSMLEDFCGGRAALELLERSLERDPGYAPAWELLAVAHYNQVWACGASSENFASALEAIERAMELAPKSIAPRLLQNAILIETNRVEEAYSRLRRFSIERSSQPEVVASELYALRYAGFLGLASRRLDHLLVLDPLYYSLGASGESPNSLLYLEDYDRFLAVLPDSGSAYHRFYQGLAEILRGRGEEARAALEPAFREHPGEIFGRYAQALLAILDGDREAARIILDQIVRQRRDLDATDGEMSFKEAQLYALMGRRQAALGQLEEAVGQGFFCPRCLAEDPLLVDLRDEPAFVSLLEKAVDRHRAFALQFGLDVDLPGAGSSGSQPKRRASS